MTTLAELCGALHAEMDVVVDIPEQSSRSVSGAVMMDVADSPSPKVGGIALGVGLHADDARIAESLGRLVAQGYTALAFKRHGRGDAELRLGAREAGITLLRVRDSVAWDHLTDLIAATVTFNESPLGSLAHVAPGDLFSLANAVASLAGGAVAIADPHQNVLAYSTVSGQPIDDTRRESILQLHVPHSKQNDIDYRQVHASRDIVIVSAEENSLVRKALAIRAGTTVLGSMWIIDESSKLDAESSRVLHEAADVAAIHLLRHRADHDVARVRHLELMSGLLFDETRAELAAIQLGVSAQRVQVVAFAATAHPGTAPEHLHAGMRVFDTIRAACSVWLPSGVCGLADNIVYLVLPESAVTTSGFARETILRIVQHAGRLLGRPVLAGCSSIGLVADVAAARVSAEMILAAMLRDVEDGRLAADSDGAVGDATTLGPRLRLRQIAAQLGGSSLLPGETVARMAEYDERRRTSFAETLMIYLECDSNAIETATRMMLHPNTVRYRVSRLEPLFGLRLDDPDARLLVWLELWCARAEK